MNSNECPDGFLVKGHYRTIFGKRVYVKPHCRHTRVVNASEPKISEGKQLSIERRMEMEK